MRILLIVYVNAEHKHNAFDKNTGCLYCDVCENCGCHGVTRNT
jgi:hypothetical protein